MRYWTSDLHFGHTNIIKYCDRPVEVEYADSIAAAAMIGAADAMNEMLITNWNSVVLPEDEVMVVGDVALGKLQLSLENVRRLNGHLKLVPGNHDKCWSGHKHHPRFLGLYESVGFSILPEQMTISVGGQDVNVCHFPYHGDSRSEGDRFPLYRMVDDGLPLLCGHVHDAWATDGRQYNVGVDVHDYKPVPEDRIIEWLKSL